MGEPLAHAEAHPKKQSRARTLSNASYMTAASLLSKIFSLVFVVIATHHFLNPGQWGNYTNVQSVVGLFGLVTDLGMNTLAIRDVTQNHALALRYISNLLVFRGLLTLLTLPIIVITSLPSTSYHLAVIVYALALLPNSISNALQLAFQFEERFSYSAAFAVVGAAATSGLSLLSLQLGHRLLGLFVVFTGVAFCNAIVTIYLVYTRFLPLRLEIDFSWWPELLKKALPFVILTALNILYNRADMYILAIMKCTQHHDCVPTGTYNVAYRVVDVLVTVFVGSINTATLPAFNRVMKDSKLELARFLRLSISLMLVLGVPVALFGSFFSQEAIAIMGGKNFYAAIPSMAVLVWTFPLFLIEGMCFNALYALHRQRTVIITFGITLVFNVSLNLLLIPHYSFMACSALTVASELLNTIIVFSMLRRELGPLGFGVGLAKVALVSLATGLTLWITHPLTIFISLPLGVLAMVVSLRYTRFFGEAEREILGRLPLLGRYAVLI